MRLPIDSDTARDLLQILVSLAYAVALIRSGLSSGWVTLLGLLYVARWTLSDMRCTR